MAKNEFREQILKQYAQQLRTEEKSRATIEKYLRDVRRFGRWLRGQGITKEQVIGYKQQLLQSGYALRSANSMLASVNHFLRFCSNALCGSKTAEFTVLEMQILRVLQRCGFFRTFKRLRIRGS